jgi:MarR family transcriptional regulator, 2-MHQ and catechol-resistance regulon repressor
MDDERLFKSLTFLRDFSTVYTKAIMEATVPLKPDLKFSHLKHLYAFRDSECITIKEFALILGLKFPNTTMVVDGIEQEGLVEREHCQQDRRKVFVKLTAMGKKIREGFLQQRHRVAEDIFQHISENEAALLLKSLENVCVLLDKAFVHHTETKKD